MPEIVALVVVATIAVALDEVVYHQPFALGSNVSSKKMGWFAPMLEVELITIVVVPLPAMLEMLSGLLVK